MERGEIYIRHISDAVTAIEAYTRGVSKEKFLQDKMMQDAVIRELEIIGEAAKRLSDDTKSGDVDVPWRDIADMRNILIHEYFGVDLTIVWETLQSDIPQLKRALFHTE